MSEHIVVIQDIWLMREENAINVYVKKDGLWYLAINESDGQISHCISSHGIELLDEPSDWLNNHG